MGLFSKKEKADKPRKSACLYAGDRLGEKAAKQMIKRAVIMNGIKEGSPVCAVLAAAAFPNTQNYAVLTDTDLGYLETNGATFRANRFPLDTITSINTSGVGKLASNIFLSVGGAGLVELDVKAIMQETDAFCDMIRERMKKDNAPASVSSADEIMKFKQLLDEGLSVKRSLKIRKSSCYGYKKSPVRQHCGC